jgi:hypothetical protein
MSPTVCIIQNDIRPSAAPTKELTIKSYHLIILSHFVLEYTTDWRWTVNWFVRKGADRDYTWHGEKGNPDSHSE